MERDGWSVLGGVVSRLLVIALGETLLYCARQFLALIWVVELCTRNIHFGTKHASATTAQCNKGAHFESTPDTRDVPTLAVASPAADGIQPCF